jgi:Na+/H+-dicarboxylate symporter
VPFAVFGVVASVVAKSGADVVASLGAFLGTVLLGLALHMIVYYAILLRTLGGRSPLWFFARAKEPILTALSCGSSLATLPVTLKALREDLKASSSSARLAACVGTNLNHDGIILYEAAATLFLAQAFGHPLGFPQALTVAFASVMAGIGIAGIPEAGLITLPLVLSAVGLPNEQVAQVIPLVLPVDWIIGRMRAATNVTSDMVVALLLDKYAPSPASPHVDDEV